MTAIYNGPADGIDDYFYNVSKRYNTLDNLQADIEHTNKQKEVRKQ